MRKFSSLAVRGLLGAACLIALGAGLAASGTATPPPFAPVANEGASGGLSLSAKVFTAGGWVEPGGTYPLILSYKADAAVATATIAVTLHGASVLIASTPAASSGNGTGGAPLTYTVGPLLAGATGKIIVELRGKTLVEDPEVMWKDLSADVTLTVPGQSVLALRTHGPKVTTLESARFGDRPFPVVMVQYQDVKHCTGVDTPLPGCLGNHTAATLDTAINSRTTGHSLWQLYQDMSFGQLYPIGTVAPPLGSTTAAFTPGYNHKFSTMDPNGFCSGTTVAAAHGTPVYASRIENGWYLLPGTQGYYGSDGGGQAIVGAPYGSIDDGCGPTAKIVYDAASLADPDIDYNDYDTDKDGVVDFFNLMFAGCGGHGCLDPSGPNNIWPHKSDVRYYYTDANGVAGYVSNDPLKDHFGRPLYYVDATRKAFTLTDTGLPAYVVVGPYNVNPEDANEKVSVVAHEYGHSLGLPDFYNNSYEAMGTWELMGTDYFQYMTVYSRAFLGWIVPRVLQSGEVTLRESKYDTGEIHWKRPDGSPYVLTGAGIHNADAWRLDLPTKLLIDQVPSGTHAWFSGAGNDFGCAPSAGHNLDLFLPGLNQYGSAAAVTLTFQSFYQIEWDWDYAFVMVSDDGGATWKTLPSANGTTIANSYNPNNAGCFATWNNGITGVFAGGGNTLANPNRPQNLYPASPGHGFVADKFDLTAYKGKSIIIRFSYFTDPAAVYRGWFIDDVKVTADSAVVYDSDFESGNEDDQLFTGGWTWISTTQGTDTEHAYFLELRSRVSNDFDGKNQSDRGVPGWEGGVSMIYSDRQHSFGNTGAADHPGQTPVDSVPDPGNDSPNLNDAAFTLARPDFNGCTHIDNYPDPSGPGGFWKLPNPLKFTVLDIAGLATGAAVPGAPATATVLAEVFPNCDQVLEAPVLSIGTGYENPDTDGAFQLTWTRAAAAVGPDTLQQATSCSATFTDDAAEPLVAGANSLWETNGQWTSSANPSDGSEAYYVPDLSSQDETLTMVGTIDIPAGYSSTLTFTTTQGLESTYDFGYVEVSVDGGPFTSVAEYSGPFGFGATPADVFEGTRTVDLSDFAGHSIKLQFRMTSDLYNEGAPAGWYIDNITVTNSDWTDVAQTNLASFQVAGHPNGSFCYRVQTRFPAPGTTLASEWSNVVGVTVDVVDAVNLAPIADAGVNFAVDEGAGAALSGAGSSDPENGTLAYEWSQTAGPPVTIANKNDAMASFTAPSVATDTPLTFQLKVTDDGGLEATDTVVVTVRDVPAGGGGTTEPPAETTLGNNHAGALPPVTLLALGLLGLRRRRRPR